MQLQSHIAAGGIRSRISRSSLHCPNSTIKMKRNSLSIVLVLTVSSSAFVAVPLSNHVGARLLLQSSSSSSIQEPPSANEMKQDIEKLKVQAKQRLEALSEQMKELKTKETATPPKKPAIVSATVVSQTEPSIVARNDDGLQLDGIVMRQLTDPTKQETVHSRQVQAPTTELQLLQASSSSSSSSAKSNSNANNNRTNRWDLLDDTRWKIVFNIGREANTWMPASWGASGDRLLFEVMVDLTAEQNYERDDFFQGIAGAKTLKIVDAWLFPTGVGRDSVGRRPVKIAPTGAYKVLPNQGPMGTHIVRLYMDLLEDVQQKVDSDTVCPQGRIYATCGYFPIVSSRPGEKHWKDILAEEQHAIVMKLEELQRENDMDNRIFSLDQLTRMKEMYQVRKELDRVSKQLQEARQREPDRSQLRLSRDGKVGLSREGGVCAKVNKGLAVEYHILGRMEVASIEQRDSHDEYEELVHQLHP